MAFINNMRDKLSQASQSAVQKAKDLSEIARLNGVISSTEKQIAELYGKIGYEVYRAYCDAPLPEVAEMIEKVTELHHEIEASKAQINAINAADTCPQCGAKVGKGMAFCSSCGFKLPVQETPAAEQPSAFCSNCGAPVAANSAFCTSCGQKIG